MEHNDLKYQSIDELRKRLSEQERQLQDFRIKLEEAEETIEAIRTGQIDALVVEGEDGHQLYTLRSADQTYRVFIEKMTEGAVTLSQQGLVLYANTQFASILQKPLSSIIGIPFNEFVAPENREQYNELFVNSWKGDCKGEVFLSSNGSNWPVQLSLTTLELEGGLALSIIITDLSFQKAIQEQLVQKNLQLEATNRALEASNHDLQQFASVASHDLQEPLRKIQMFSNFINLEDHGLSAESQKYFEKIIDSAARMKTLIIDILAYSRLSANNAQMERTDLNEIFQELIEDFDLLIAEKGATIHIQKLPPIEVNKGQMRQVFQNIISNALKFSTPGVAPAISVTAKNIAEKSFHSPEDANGPFCEISIKDNGIGFDEKYLYKIFALFERLNSKDKYEGTGIGMSIAKKVIDKHNGLITANSIEGHGSEFKIILPLKQL